MNICTHATTHNVIINLHPVFVHSQGW